MENVNPNEIPDIIVLACEIYNRGNLQQASTEEKNRISTFFMKYMGKAIEDCQQASKDHWQVTRAKSDVAFETKVVEVKGPEGIGSVQFIVATGYGPTFHKEGQVEQFKKDMFDKVIDTYADPDNGDWVMVFNSLLFATQVNGAFNTSLFVGIRMSKENFVTHEEGPGPEEPLH